MRIAFVLNDLRLSGGVNVILQYASRISSKGEHTVSLLVRDLTESEWSRAHVGQALIVEEPNWDSHSFDIAVATYWETLLILGQVRSNSFVWFCQLLEDRFFPDRNPSISSMQLAGSIPLPVVTEANWIKDVLVSQNADRTVEVVLNGVDKSIFSEEKLPHSAGKGFQILVEGSLDSIAKNVEFALEGTLQSRLATGVTHIGRTAWETQDPRYHFVKHGLSFSEMAQMYRTHHVQVKASLAEGMFGPPLEGFHCGLPAIVTPVTGAEEYIENEVNALVVLWDDTRGIGRAIDRLASDNHLWRSLQSGARFTARRWPDWDSQAELFESALIRVASTSKLTQAELGNMGRTIQFSDMLHWLAMRRLSDKSVRPRVMEELAYPSTTAGKSFSARILRKLISLVGKL